VRVLEAESRILQLPLTARRWISSSAAIMLWAFTSAATLAWSHSQSGSHDASHDPAIDRRQIMTKGLEHYPSEVLQLQGVVSIFPWTVQTWIIVNQINGLTTESRLPLRSAMIAQPIQAGTNKTLWGNSLLLTIRQRGRGISDFGGILR
jgi:hypothetical protein